MIKPVLENCNYCRDFGRLEDLVAGLDEVCCCNDGAGFDVLVYIYLLQLGKDGLV